MAFRWIYRSDRTRHLVRDCNLPTVTLCGQPVGSYAGLVQNPEAYRKCEKCEGKRK